MYIYFLTGKHSSKNRQVATLLSNGNVHFLFSFLIWFIPLSGNSMFTVESPHCCVS
jgi:hypothetical protein